MVIDGDGHYVEPANIWQDFIDPSFRDRVSVVYDNEGGVQRVVLDDFVLCAFDKYGGTKQPFQPGDFFTPGGIKQGSATGRRFEEAHPGGWDARVRLNVHDENGIDAAVIFPTFGMACPLASNDDMAEAACRAVNNWAHEYVSVAPGELYVVSSLPWQSPEAAARELRRAVDELGFVAGAIMPCPARDGRKISDPSLDVLWATAVDLDVPMCVHAAARADVDQLGDSRAESYLSRHAAVHSFEGMMAFALLYETNVFDRFPTLRIGFMESSCGWVPFWLERLHEHWELLGYTFDPPILRSPMQVFVEQCVVGCEGEEHMVPYVQSLVGEEKVIWASDFPHYDTEPPFTKDMLERKDMTESQRDGVMARAAMSFYRLDPKHIRESKERRLATTAS